MKKKLFSTSNNIKRFFSLIIVYSRNKASATMNGKHANINWKTMGEKGMSYYEVEKSIDAVNFQSIGKQAAKIIAIASYTECDNNLTEGNNYYRIKGISENGTSIYSNTVKLTTNTLPLTTTIYPNPMTGITLNVQLGNIVAGKYVVSIYNSLGQNVNEQTISHEGGNGIHSIYIKQTIVSGLYNVKIRNLDSKQVICQSIISVL